jgi:hypothetical protein
MDRVQRALRKIPLLSGLSDAELAELAPSRAARLLTRRRSLHSAGVQTLAWNPDLARDILRLLARYQGMKNDAWRAGEPGKILHELGAVELARTNRIPHTP